MSRKIAVSWTTVFFFEWAVLFNGGVEFLDEDICSSAGMEIWAFPSSKTWPLLWLLTWLLPCSTLFGEGVPIDPGVAKFDTCRRLCRKQPAAILDFWSTIWPALAACILVFT